MSIFNFGEQTVIDLDERADFDEGAIDALTNYIAGLRHHYKSGYFLLGEVCACRGGGRTSTG